MTVGGGSDSGGAGARSRGGGAGVSAATIPARPRQQRKAEARAPVHYHRRPSSTVVPTNTAIPSRNESVDEGSDGRAVKSSASSTSERNSAASGSGGPGSRVGSRNHSHEEGGVRVVVRVRPLSTAEEEQGGDRTMRCCNPKSLEFMTAPVGAAAMSGGAGLSLSAGSSANNTDSAAGGMGGTDESRSYSFDLCAHEGFSQEQMFQSCGLMPLLSAAIDGYAGTVFAYGATGAGKTYTMSGHEQILRSGSGSKGARHRGKAAVRGKVPGNSNGGGEGGSTDGLIPRSMRFLFQRIAALRSGVTMRVRASFYEIYNEVVYDLLAQGERRPLQVRYDVKRGFFVQGLFEVEIRGLNDIMAVVDEGNGNRRVSSHLLNKDSSRSHSLLTVYLHSEWKDPDDGHVVKMFGKVSFVDLAGSERLKKSKALNEKETASINKSLMTLGKVISALSRRSAATAATANALAEAEAGMDPRIVDTPSSSGAAEENSPVVSHHNMTNHAGNGAACISTADLPNDIWVPYRDSTLTKLLMDSLGGNGLTLMVACVSPSSRHVEESAATLNYAARARNIRNRPRVRIDARERLINALRREINLLREENELLRREKLAPLSDESTAVGPLSQDCSRGGGGDKSDDIGGRSPRGWLNGSTPPTGHRNGGGRGRGREGGRRGEGVGDVAGSRSGAGGAAAVSMAARANAMGLSSQRHQEAAALQIGQASRDVAALLRKYEEECHRLRKEAARAQHKELEISNQTRQALLENDALSRTVERLQKDFAAEKVQIETGKRHREGENEESTEPPQKGATLSSDKLVPALSINATDVEIVGTRESMRSEEVMHLRRVNEALVERMEAMERTQSKPSHNDVGAGRGSKTPTAVRRGGGGRGGAKGLDRVRGGQDTAGIVPNRSNNGSAKRIRTSSPPSPTAKASAPKAGPAVRSAASPRTGEPPSVAANATKNGSFRSPAATAAKKEPPKRDARRDRLPLRQRDPTKVAAAASSANKLMPVASPGKLMDERETPLMAPRRGGGSRNPTQMVGGRGVGKSGKAKGTTGTVKGASPEAALVAGEKPLKETEKRPGQTERKDEARVDDATRKGSKNGGWAALRNSANFSWQDTEDDNNRHDGASGIVSEANETNGLLSGTAGEQKAIGQGTETSSEDAGKRDKKHGWTIVTESAQFAVRDGEGEEDDDHRRSAAEAVEKSSTHVASEDADTKTEVVRVRKHGWTIVKQIMRSGMSDEDDGEETGGDDVVTPADSALAQDADEARIDHGDKDDERGDAALVTTAEISPPTTAKPPRRTKGQSRGWTVLKQYVRQRKLERDLDRNVTSNERRRISPEGAKVVEGQHGERNDGPTTQSGDPSTSMFASADAANLDGHDSNDDWGGKSSGVGAGGDGGHGDKGSDRIDVTGVPKTGVSTATVALPAQIIEEVGLVTRGSPTNSDYEKLSKEVPRPARAEKAQNGEQLDTEVLQSTLTTAAAAGAGLESDRFVESVDDGRAHVNSNPNPLSPEAHDVVPSERDNNHDEAAAPSIDFNARSAVGVGADDEMRKATDVATPDRQHAVSKLKGKGSSGWNLLRRKVSKQK